MKLRVLVVLLLLANLFYALWAQGVLAIWGIEPQPTREPAYVQSQIKPEALVLRHDQQQRQQAQRNNPTQCLLSPLLDIATGQAVQAIAQQSLPAGSWQSLPQNSPGQWMVYMGRYPNEAALTRKKQELERLRIDGISEAPADYQPGLALGYFDNQKLAQERLSQLQSRSVRSAQLVTIKAPVEGVQIRIDQATEAMRAELAKMRPILQGQEFVPCP